MQGKARQLTDNLVDLLNETRVNHLLALEAREQSRQAQVPAKNHFFQKRLAVVGDDALIAQERGQQ